MELNMCKAVNYIVLKNIQRILEKYIFIQPLKVTAEYELADIITSNVFLHVTLQLLPHYIRAGFHKASCQTCLDEDILIAFTLLLNNLEYFICLNSFQCKVFESEWSIWN